MLPEVSEITELIFHVPPSLWDIYNDGYDPSVGSNFVSRFIRLVVHGDSVVSQSHFTLGKVEVYGHIPKSRGTPAQDRNNLRMTQIEEKARILAELIGDSQNDGPVSASEPDESEKDHQQELSHRADNGLGTGLFRTPNGVCPPEGANVPKDDERMSWYDKEVQGALNNGKVRFTEVLRLEHERLVSNVTPAERDEVLTRLGLSDKLCPYNYQYTRDEKFEMTLAQNVVAKAQACPCGTAFGFFTRGTFVCCYCRQKTCIDCTSNMFLPVNIHILVLPCATLFFFS